MWEASNDIFFNITSKINREIKNIKIFCKMTSKKCFKNLTAELPHRLAVIMSGYLTWIQWQAETIVHNDCEQGE